MPYPDDPGFVAGSETSKAAAESMEESASSLRAAFLGLIRDALDGLTCDEIEVLTGHRHQTVSARCVELKNKGLVEPIGTRVTRSGRMAEVLFAVKEVVPTEPPTRLAKLLAKLQIVVGQIRQEMPSASATAETVIIGQRLMDLGDELYKLGVDAENKV